eukprot:ANDGO_03052.mRNA.1 hypothetical protein
MADGDVRQRRHMLTAADAPEFDFDAGLGNGREGDGRGALGVNLEEVKSISESILAGMYSSRPDLTLVDRYYSADTRFEDPLSMGDGRESVSRLFGLVAKCCASIVNVSTSLDVHTPLEQHPYHSREQKHRKVVVESDALCRQKYKLKYLPIAIMLDNHVHLEFDQHSKVILHRDEWPITQLITGLRPAWTESLL